MRDFTSVINWVWEDTFCTYWWVLVGTWLYLSVLVLTDCVLVCFGMNCLYRGICMYWSLVSISQYLCIDLLYTKQYAQWGILTVFACICLCSCVLVYLSVNWPVVPYKNLQTEQFNIDKGPSHLNLLSFEQLHACNNKKDWVFTSKQGVIDPV